MKKISIIIPVYNAEKYLDVCLQSVVKQTYGNIEIICIDDGSIDNSKLLCEGWVQKDQRIRYFYQKNQGVSAARNKGIDLATGDYICFLDSDDCIHNKYVETLLSKSEKNNTVFCNITRKKDLGTGNKTQYFSKKIFIQKVVFEQIKHPGFTCFLYDRSIIKNNNIRFHEGCFVNEDYEFYLKYLTFSGNNVVYLDYKGYYYRENDDSAISSPISYENLTSIGAARRINDFLFQKNIIKDSSILFSNGILIYTYAVSIQNNYELYNYIHKEYNVRKAMRKMLFFPRIKKKILALLYLIVGPNLFYKTVQILK